MLNRVPLLIFATFLCIFTHSTRADENAATVDEVQVIGIKDPAIIPYKRAYELGSRVRAVSQDRVALQVRLTSTADDMPIPGLTVHVVGSSVDVPAVISPAGFLAVPLDERAYDEGADFIVNQRKGVVRMRVFLVPNAPTGSLTYGDVTDTVRLARAARADILPWYLRAVTPTINGLGLCFDGPGHAVAIGSEAVRREADAREKDDAGNKLWCADFKPDEPFAAAAALITDRSVRLVFLESTF